MLKSQSGEMCLPLLRVGIAADPFESFVLPVREASQSKESACSVWNCWPTVDQPQSVHNDCSQSPRPLVGKVSPEIDPKDTSDANQ